MVYRLVDPDTIKTMESLESQHEKQNTFIALATTALHHRRPDEPSRLDRYPPHPNSLSVNWHYSHHDNAFAILDCLR